MADAATTPPAGFTRLTIGGEFISANGPLYERLDGALYQLGFRVEARHTNSMGICHGGMMASFCDMLLPLGAFRRVDALRTRFLPTVSLQIDYRAPAPRPSTSLRSCCCSQPWITPMSASVDGRT